MGHFDLGFTNLGGTRFHLERAIGKRESNPAAFMVGDNRGLRIAAAKTGPPSRPTARHTRVWETPVANSDSVLRPAENRSPHSASERANRCLACHLHHLVLITQRRPLDQLNRAGRYDRAAAAGLMTARPTSPLPPSVPACDRPYPRRSPASPPSPTTRRRVRSDCVSASVAKTVREPSREAIASESTWYLSSSNP